MLSEKIKIKIQLNPKNQCWEWKGEIGYGGYGRMYHKGRSRVAHRIVYELVVGEIPKGLQLDHLCRNRCCVNPKHLEPVTRYVNILRDQGAAAIHARKNYCIRGHKFDLKNTGILSPSKGRKYARRGVKYRVCRKCAVIRQNKYIRRKGIRR